MEHPMAGAKVDELRELMRLADKLKTYVRETNDPFYSRLFLEASEALQQRAHVLAHGEPQAHNPLNILC